ncbi:MAG: flagellar hook-associated protein FlgL [Rubrivivax sp.]
MRIVSANTFATSVETLQLRQQDLMLAQDRLTSGKRVSRASDDPAAAARVERALAAASRSDADQRALEASRNAMQQAESALGDAGEMLQQVRELVVSAGNGTYTAAERQQLGLRIAGLREQLLAVANRSDGVAGFLFGGQGSAQPPFVDGAGGVQFRGASGQTLVPGGELLPMTFDGRQGWLQARSGNGVFVTSADAGNGPDAWIDAGRVTDPALLSGDAYSVLMSGNAPNASYSVLRNGAPTAAVNLPFTPGQAIEFDGMALTIGGTPSNGDRFELMPSANDLSLFGTLERIATGLQNSQASSAQSTQVVQHGLRDIDALAANLQLQRSQAGSSLNRIDSVENRLADIKLGAQTDRSLAEDLDMVHAISDFQNKQTGYDAALKTYSLVQRMSLFQYLNV